MKFNLQVQEIKGEIWADTINLAVPAGYGDDVIV
jgi:hypothetical protein